MVVQKEQPVNVKVISRFRPLNEFEQKLSLPNFKTSKGGRGIAFPLPSAGLSPSCVEFDEDGKGVAVKSRDGNDPHRFTYDHTFSGDVVQNDIYDVAAADVVTDVLNGINGTIFAYGQTGSGKTHTMMGPTTDESLVGYCSDPKQQGIIPRAIEHLFKKIDANKKEDDISVTVYVSYLEIYMERIRDLLDPRKHNLQIHEDKIGGRGMYVADSTEVEVDNYRDVMNLLMKGASSRAVASTKMNAQSSRSHSIFIITIMQQHRVNMEQTFGKLFLVDLAGSEQVSKTGASGHTLEEAKRINKSLSALGNVINALVDQAAHIPYRDSKLTRLLQDSLGGNSRTSLIVCCSPSSLHESETLSTLRFGNRAKNIKNKPHVNTQLTPERMKQLLKEAEMNELIFKEYIVGLEDALKNSGLSFDASMIGALLTDEERGILRSGGTTGIAVSATPVGEVKTASTGSLTQGKQGVANVTLKLSDLLIGGGDSQGDAAAGEQAKEATHASPLAHLRRDGIARRESEELFSSRMVAELRQENANLRDEIEELNDDLQDKMGEHTKLTDQVDELKQELDKVNRLNGTMEKENESHVLILQDLNERYEKYQTAYLPELIQLNRKLKQVINTMEQQRDERGSRIRFSKQELNDILGLWYYLNADCATQGPVPFNELFDLYKSGMLSDDSYVIREPMEQWVKFNEVDIAAKLTSGQVRIDLDQFIKDQNRIGNHGENTVYDKEDIEALSGQYSDSWYFINETEQFEGPVTFIQLQELWKQQRINSYTYVIREPWNSWKQVIDVFEFVTDEQQGAEDDSMNMSGTSSRFDAASTAGNSETATPSRNNDDLNDFLHSSPAVGQGAFASSTPKKKKGLLKKIMSTGKKKPK